MNNIIIAGCSASYGDNTYAEFLKTKEYDVINLSYPGQSNNAIIYKIYQYITNQNIRNANIICQLTWLHRFGAYSTVLQEWVDYQPNAWNIIPSYNKETDSVNFNFNLDKVQLNRNEFPEKLKKILGNNTNEYNEMLKMYTTYLKYHYDDVESFKYLLYQIDTLKTYVETFNNKITFFYWPTIVNREQISEMQKRDFINIENEYSIIKWFTKNDLLDGKSAHMSIEGHKFFAQHLKHYIK